MIPSYEHKAEGANTFGIDSSYLDGYPRKVLVLDDIRNRLCRATVGKEIYIEYDTESGHGLLLDDLEYDLESEEYVGIPYFHSESEELQYSGLPLDWVADTEFLSNTIGKYNWKEVTDKILVHGKKVTFDLSKTRTYQIKGLEGLYFFVLGGSMISPILVFTDNTFSLLQDDFSGISRAFMLAGRIYLVATMSYPETCTSTFCYYEINVSY